MSHRFVRAYRDWCVSGTLACAVAGFPTTPLGPLLLWTLVLPALAAWLLHRRSRASATAPGLPISGTPHLQARLRRTVTAVAAPTGISLR